MRSFLESVLDNIPDWGTQSKPWTFILPSKRAGFFLKSIMARRTEATCFTPVIFSIEDFVEQVSGIRYASSIHLSFRLYEAYSGQDIPGKESFPDFSKWAPALLQDFNEIDRYLINPQSLFKTLATLKEIRNWTLEGTDSVLIEKRTAFWKRLEPVYDKFRSLLRAEGLGYQGMAYREAVSRIEAFVASVENQRFVFAGFNALNASESRIIQYMLENSDTRIFWDADPHYLDNPVHDAGFFLRQHLKDWPALKKGLEGTDRHFTSTGKIHVVGLPKSVSQAKYCGGLIATWCREDPSRLEKTALVLGDETILEPILHSLPAELPAVNITMSYPVRNSPMARLFELLLEIRKTRVPSGWNIHPVLELLAHPNLQDWLRFTGVNPNPVRQALIRQNNLYIPTGELSAAGLPDKLIQLLFPADHLDIHGTIADCIGLALELKPLCQQSGDPVSLEYLHHFYSLFNQLRQMVGEFPFLGDLRALIILFRQLLEDAKVDFEGQPLTGLQIMGMLESRNLDYETVVITSVNEGILPSGKTNTSFIPFDVKKEFGLPTYKEKDAVYTYHFYRLLQRAKSIYLCYNTEPDALEGGERSRFIEQVRTDPLLGKRVQMHTVTPVTGPLPDTNTAVPKSQALMDRLGELAVSGLSPTALARYIDDPLLFYRRNVLGIRETDELEESVAANTFGTVLHQALEDLYRPLEGELLRPNLLRDLKGQAHSIVSKVFQENYLKDGRARGKNLIALQVMKQHLDLFIESEVSLAEKHEVRIIGVEQRIERELELPGLDFPVKLKGTVDRIEAVDGTLRIIDFKTGSVVPSDLRIMDWENLITGKKHGKAFQVLCYAWLYGSMPEAGIPLKAGIISFKSLGKGRQWFGLRGEGRSVEEEIGPDELRQFQEVLRRLVMEIFDPAVPFAPTKT